MPRAPQLEGRSAAGSDDGGDDDDGCGDDDNLNALCSGISIFLNFKFYGHCLNTWQVFEVSNLRPIYLDCTVPIEKLVAVDLGGWAPGGEFW